MKEQFKVLLVVDNDSARKQYKDTLKTVKDLKVEEANNGQKTLKRIQESAPDIIICDLESSKMDSLSLCRMLKKDPDSELSDIYLIIPVICVCVRPCVAQCIPSDIIVVKIAIAAE